MLIYGNSAPDAELVLLYGNCQVPYFAQLLAAADAPHSGRGFVCVSNHSAPGGELIFPERSLLDRCTLYLEQLEAPRDIPLRTYLRDNLVSVPKVVFPSLYMMSFWPFESIEPRGSSSVHYPWRRYPHGEMVGLRIAEQGLRGEAAYDAYMSLAAERMPDLLRRMEWDFTTLRTNDQSCDVPLGSWVERTYRTHYSFWTPGHLSAECLGNAARLLFDAVFPLLGGSREEKSACLETAIGQASGIGELQLPINPLVVEQLGLQFVNADTRYQWYDQQWTFREYITRYIAYDESWGHQDG